MDFFDLTTEQVEYIFTLTPRYILPLFYVSNTDSYGTQIRQVIFEETGGTCNLPCGTLYPILSKLQQLNFLAIYDDSNLSSHQGAQRRMYTITTAGQAVVRVLNTIYNELGRSSDVSDLANVSDSMRDKVRNLLKTPQRGTLILRYVSKKNSYGAEISTVISTLTDDKCNIKSGTLYSTLHRLTTLGFLESYDQDSTIMYKTTSAGRAVLDILDMFHDNLRERGRSDQDE